MSRRITLPQSKVAPGEHAHPSAGVAHNSGVPVPLEPPVPFDALPGDDWGASGTTAQAPAAVTRSAAPMRRALRSEGLPAERGGATRTLPRAVH
jgi:hypothetical protein